MSSGPLSPTLTDASGASEADSVGHSHTQGAKRKAADGYESCGNTEGCMVQKVQLDHLTGFYVRHTHITIIM